MRCPKCGFISFDHLDSCRKCGKNIAQAAAALNGTVYAALAPNFLEGEHGGAADEEDYEDSFPESGGIDATQSIEMDQLEDNLEFSMDKEQVDDEAEFDLEMDLNALEESPESNELDLGMTEDLDELGLGEFTEEKAEEPTELALDDDLFGQEEERVAESPQLNFDDIDMSDLQAPQEEAEKESLTETFILDDEFSDDTPAPAAPPRRKAQPSPAPAADKQRGELEDLLFDGIELGDSPSARTPASKQLKSQKGVKTGTALDEFEIDLGDLIPKK